MPPEINRSFSRLIYAAAFISISVSIVVLGLSLFLSNEIFKLSIISMDAVGRAKFEVALGHLALKEISNKERNEEIRRVQQYFVDAQNNIKALIQLSRNDFGWPYAFGDKDSLKKLDTLKADLEQFVKISITRYTLFDTSGTKLSSDEDFERFCKRLLDHIDRIQTNIRSSALNRISGHRRIQYSLIFLLSIIILFSGLYIRANLKLRRETERELLSLSHDINEQYRIKQTMVENEVKLRSILKLAPIGIGMIKEDVFQQVNEHMGRISGYFKEELIGQTSQILYASVEEFHRVEREEREQMRSMGTAAVETLWRRRDGTIMNVLYSSTPQEKGFPEKGIIFTALDITSWKKTQIRLRASEEKFRLLAENTVDCIWLMDLNLTFLYINPSILYMLGYTVEEWVGSRLEDHFPPQEIQLMGAYIDQELKKGAHSNGVVFETSIFNKQHELIPVEISGKILFDSSEQPVGLQGTTRDISRRKMAEDEVKRLNRDLEQRVMERTAQLNAANKELESFAYSVSHDLRAPLRSIDGFSRALMEDYHDALDQVGRDYLRRVRQNTERMGGLIENMLKLSRSMSCEMKKERVNLSAMAHLIIEELKSHDKDRNVTSIIASNIFARGDSHLLRVVLDNLIGNAWKFTARKKETAHIEFGMREENGTSVYFVKDDGAGFDMAYSDKLFLVFQRLHTTDDFPGSGVGLATVARIIQRHSGRIWAEGKLEQGAVFYFTLQ